MSGGSYLVARRIRMLIESWDTDYLADQENVFGRFKTSGAPLTGNARVRHRSNLEARTPRPARPVIPLNAHIRLAAPATNGGQKILRRGYSYTDGIDPDDRPARRRAVLHRLPEGPAQAVRRRSRRTLGRSDNLNEYIRHTGSGLFAVPPGLSAPGDWFGKTLFT